jgi:hypothetical protein
MPKQVIKLPLVGALDGDQVIDDSGNRYEFDAEERTWIYHGIIQTPPIVSQENPGIITPKIFEKLNLINKLIKNGVKFDQFKIDVDGLSPYFYFFYSSDDLVRFYPESQNKLRVEIDRARMLSKITKTCCRGPKGKIGLQGKQGRDGIKAGNEKFLDPIFAEDNELRFETTVSTPLDTRISLRIFRSDITILELLIPIGDTDEVTVIQFEDSPEVEMSSLIMTYDVVTQHLSGTIRFTSGADDIGTWKYKARQIGLKGEKGDNGSSFFQIIEQFFDDPLLRSTDAMVSLRKPFTTDNVLFVKKPMFEDVCSFNLLHSGVMPMGKIDKASLVAVSVTSKQCKDIGKFKFIPDEFIQPKLDLPAWTPTPDCCDAGHYNVRRFNWFERVNPRYMFKIATDPRPPEQCCEEDFFWCPNIGDNTCGISGKIDPPVTFEPHLTGSPGLDFCECDSPIAFELQNGGFTLPPINCPNGPLSSGSVSSVIGGSVDQFNEQISVAGGWKVTVKVSFDDELCKEQRNKPGYVDNCQVKTKASINDDVKSGNMPITYEFSGDTGFVNGNEESFCPKKTFALKLIVNEDQINCCRGYKVETSVQCVCPTGGGPGIPDPPVSQLPPPGTVEPPPEPTPGSVGPPEPTQPTVPSGFSFVGFENVETPQSPTTTLSSPPPSLPPPPPPPPAALQLSLTLPVQGCIGGSISVPAWASATGGVPPYSFTVTVGTLPLTVSLGLLTGNLNGALVTVLSSSVDITVTDAVLNTDTMTVSVTGSFDPGACPSPPFTKVVFA